MKRIDPWRLVLARGRQGDLCAGMAQKDADQFAMTG